MLESSKKMKFSLLLLLKIHFVLSCPSGLEKSNYSTTTLFTLNNNEIGESRVVGTTTLNTTEGHSETEASSVSIEHTILTQPSIAITKTLSNTDETNITTTESGDIVTITEDLSGPEFTLVYFRNSTTESGEIAPPNTRIKRTPTKPTMPKTEIASVSIEHTTMTQSLIEMLKTPLKMAVTDIITTLSSEPVGIATVTDDLSGPKTMEYTLAPRLIEGSESSTSTEIVPPITPIKPTPKPKPLLEYKIFAIYIKSGKKVLAVNDRLTTLSLEICAKQTEKDKCCKTKPLYSRYFTKPNGPAVFNRKHELGTCYNFLVGMENVNDPLDSVKLSFKTLSRKSQFDAKNIWICLTSDGQKHHMLECSGISTLGPESMTIDVISNCKLQRKKSCLMLRKRSWNQ